MHSSLFLKTALSNIHQSEQFYTATITKKIPYLYIVKSSGEPNIQYDVF